MAFPITPPPLGQDDFGQPVSFVVQTTGTWEDLDASVKKLLAKMAENPNLTNPDSDLKLNKPELRVEMNRDKIATVGSRRRPPSAAPWKPCWAAATSRASRRAPSSTT